MGGRDLEMKIIQDGTPMTESEILDLIGVFLKSRDETARRILIAWDSGSGYKLVKE